MSTFSITTQASQIFLGEQAEVTLYNDGPATIYLEANASVSYLNSFQLPPFGQMTWKGQTELWAVTRFGMARLSASPSGLLSITTRARTQRIIGTENIVTVGGNYTSVLYEVGQFVSIQLAIKMLTSFAGTSFAGITWYDDAQQYVTDELLSNTSAAGLIQYYQFPVRGKFFSVQYTTGGLPTASYTGTLNILGTDLPLVPGVWNSSIYGYNSGFANYTNIPIGATLPLPTFGSRMTIWVYCQTAPAGGSTLNLTDLATGVEAATMVFPGGSGIQTVTYQISPRRIYSLVSFLGIVINKMSISYPDF